MYRAVLALLQVCLGALLFWAWINEQLLTATFLAVIPFLVGIAGRLVGPFFLPRQPVIAVWVLECAVFGRLVVSSALIALGFVISFWFAASFASTVATNPELKSATEAIDKAIGAVVAVFVAIVFDAEQGKRQASLTKQQFQNFFRRDPDPRFPRAHIFAPGSDGEQLVQSEEVFGISGWNFASSLERAKKLADLV
ncbi:hypothetical protein [Ruegeria arenilitoris]|uniref:hypothetical protein n=1 Tax=Ruegeria arenilitoris TaxID=1173585 RepID=UPI00147D0366|nr:hypothetical protein [Ruegeria arenilitoris]